MSDEPSLSPEKIKEIRSKRNLSQEALAKLLGVSASTVIRWEQGTAHPTGTAATILLAMLVGPLFMPLGIAAIVGLGPWALSAYGIYRVLKEVFEAETSKHPDDQKPTPPTNQ